MAQGCHAASEKWDLRLKDPAVLTPRRESILREPLDLLGLCNKKLVGFFDSNSELLKSS